MSGQPQGLDALAGEAAAADALLTPQAAPGGIPEQAAPDQAQVIATAEEEAAAIVGLVATGIEALLPPLKYGQETRTEAAQKLAPLVAKYGASGGFLARWAAEIDAGVFFATLGWKSFQFYKLSKAKEVKPEGAGDGGGK